MTDARRQVPVAAIAGGLFCLLLIYLALQVRAGSDPAIGKGSQATAIQRPRPVIVRRVILRRIVQDAAGGGSAAAGGGGSAAAGGGGSAAAGGDGSAAPAAATPAAPAPAPAPAPVVSSGS